MAPKISEIAVEARLDESFEGIGAQLNDRRKRESFAIRRPRLGRQRQP
jgi:hypothetical protein